MCDTGSTNEGNALSSETENTMRNPDIDYLINRLNERAGEETDGEASDLLAVADLLSEAQRALAANQFARADHIIDLAYSAYLETGWGTAGITANFENLIEY